MSLHNDNGISPDSGTRGPLNREQDPDQLAPDTHLEDNPLGTAAPDAQTVETDPSSDTEPEEGHVR